METAVAANRITDNLICVPLGAGAQADPDLILDERRFTFFRGGTDGTAYYIGARPADLPQRDIEAINSHCDTGEGSRNRLVKRDIAEALKAHFNERAFHVFDMGSGKKPIFRFFPENADITFHAIDRDPACVQELHKMNIPASTWEAELNAPQDRPSVAVSVYALHFMVNDTLAENIKKLAGGPDGFFVGNFYVDPEEKKTGAEREKLGDILRRHNMSHVVMKDPGCGSSEYWVISPTGDIGAAANFAETMKDSLRKRRGKDFEMKTTLAPPPG